MSQPSFFPSPEGSLVLSDSRVREYVSEGFLISRDSFSASLLAACSYDIRVGRWGVQGGDGTEVDLSETVLTLQPGGYAGIVSLEKLKLPRDVFARIGAKRSYSYDGVILLTGSLVDPGYEGHLLFGLYNASQKRFVIRRTMKICAIVFERLPHAAERTVSPDPDLLEGRIPSDFMTRMANMDVLPWMQISERVRQIEQLTKDVFDLKARYEDVLEPIRRLTESVSRVTDDVGALTSRTRELTSDVSKLTEISNLNAQQLQQLTGSLLTLTTEVRVVRDHTQMAEDASRRHEDLISKLNERFSSFSLAVKIVWAIVLIAVSVAATIGFQLLTR
jgi:deoxycytidine triphosphate deaminase